MKAKKKLNGDLWVSLDLVLENICKLLHHNCKHLKRIWSSKFLENKWSYDHLLLNMQGLTTL
jgi:hypothetical protein